MMRKFKIITLGCKVNQAESELIATRLSGLDWQPADSPGEADVCVINTCTVTQKAAMQSRQAVRQAIHANPGACVVVTGCYAATDPQALMSIQGLDYIIDQRDKPRLQEILAAGGGRKSSTTTIIQPLEKTAPEKQAQSLPATGIRTRPFIKIQDGCDAFCSYCIVPYARGRSRSVEFQAALDSVSLLSAQGFKEAVLTGIHLGHYGKDLEPRRSLLELLQAILRLPIDMRVRLSSIEPLELTDEIIDLAAVSDRICRHFHIPLQSGDPQILSRMGRPYSPEAFSDRVAKIHHRLPNASIGADVLIGFPGETDAAFENTYQLIERLPLSYLHIFPFSARPGTAACGFPKKVPAEQIKRRCSRLRQLGSRKRLNFHRRFIGLQVQVLTESRRDPKTGLLKGVSSNYLPVLFDGGDGLINHLVDVRISEADASRLLGIEMETQKGSDNGIPAS
jgi:threonylcarbamoyladenosine tRNA methylthiotransferase MtaB